MTESAENFFLAQYAADGEVRAGIVIDDVIVDAGAALSRERIDPAERTYVTALEILGNWRQLYPRLRRIAGLVRSDEHPGKMPLSQARLLAPLLYPGSIYCAGANYRDHIAEMARATGTPPLPDLRELGQQPWHFLKAPVPCVRGPNASIALPSFSRQVDWEAEIAAVIGCTCRNVSSEEALQYVAGLTIVNDLSARDLLRRPGLPEHSPLRFDWVGSKCFDGALPIGPWICPLNQLPDVQRLRIRLWVNDELMQDSTSAHLIFPIAEQVAALSTRVTLRPGDVIATGTPAGVGAARGRFIQPGDRITIKVDGIGELVNDFTG